MTQAVELTDPSNPSTIARASVVRRRLGVLVDRLTGSGGLDPALLAELGEFLRSEAIPAAEAYEAVLEAAWVAEGGPQTRLSSCSCWRSDLTCPAESPFDALLAELEAAGYAPHRNAIDAEALASLCCVCGQALDYVGRRAAASYRAFGVCRTCGHWLEF